MRLPGGPTPAPSVDTGKVPSHEAKVRPLPEPITKSSPQREPAATTSEADTSKQGRDTRGQRQPATTASEVDTSKQGRDAHGFDRREPTTTSCAANIPELLTPQRKAPARDQPPDHSAQPTKTKENHAVPGEDGGGG